MSRKVDDVVQKIKRMNKRAEKITSSVPVFPLRDHPAFAKHSDLLGRIPAIRDAYLAVVDLNKFEAVVPDGRQFIDRSGYDYRRADVSVADGGPPAAATTHPEFDHPFHTLRDWQAAYLESERPQLLVSANWWNVWQSGVPEVGEKLQPRVTDRTHLIGLSIADGKVVSSAGTPDQRGELLDSLIVDEAERSATVVDNPGAKAAELHPKGKQAVSGFRILAAGVTQQTPDVANNHFNRVPRVGIGSSPDQKILYVLSITPGVRDQGVTVEEFAEIFRLLGVEDAINLDNMGSAELRYVGIDGLGYRQHVQTVTCDTVGKASGVAPDTERPKPNFVGFRPRAHVGRFAKDDMSLPAPATPSVSLSSSFGLWKTEETSRRLRVSKDDSDLSASDELRYDSNCNHRKKVAYESHCAALVMTKHTAVFMPVMQKVSSQLIGFFERIRSASEAEPEPASFAALFYAKMVLDYDLNILFDAKNISSRALCDTILSELRSVNPSHFYAQMCIHRSFITFFTEKGEPKPSVIDKAIEEGFLSAQYLERLISQTQHYREGKFEKNGRVDRTRSYSDERRRAALMLLRPPIFERVSTDIGIYTREDFQRLPLEVRRDMQGKLRKHKPGMAEYKMLTSGHFANEAMFVHDMPILCGPSGMTAMRIAFADLLEDTPHALNRDEKALYLMAVAWYHVAIGAHTADECFAMGDEAYTRYQRGDYESAIPKLSEPSVKFDALRSDMKKAYQDYVLCDEEVSHAMSPTKY